MDYYNGTYVSTYEGADAGGLNRRNPHRLLHEKANQRNVTLEPNYVTSDIKFYLPS